MRAKGNQKWKVPRKNKTKKTKGNQAAMEIPHEEQNVIISTKENQKSKVSRKNKAKKTKGDIQGHKSSKKKTKQRS